MGNTTIDYRKYRKKTPFFIRGVSFLSLILSTAMYNILGKINSFFGFFRGRKKVIKIKKIVVLGYGGIGNHLMLSPALSILKNIYPKALIHLVVTSKVCHDLLRNDPNIDTFFVANIGLMNRWRDYFNLGRKIKTESPDIVVSASGTNPAAGSIISFFSGSGIRVGEDWKGRGFLYTHKINVNLMISENEQNINLVQIFKKPDREYLESGFPRLYLTQNEIDHARKFISKKLKKENALLLGIHPGSGYEQKWKRWPVSRFIEVASILSEQFNLKVVFFIGPDEDDLKADLQKIENESVIVYQGKNSIRETAAIISCCNYFLSNDSGLRHIAVAFEITTVGIFGPTSNLKNYLEREYDFAIYEKNAMCRPCHYTKWWLACGDIRPCLEMVSANTIIKSFKGQLNNY